MLELVKNPMPCYRVAHWLYKQNIPVLPSLISYFIRFFWAAFIPNTAKIGTGTRLGYGGLGVVIHKDAIIGNNCLISQNVTIGGTGTKIGVPVIGNRVHIGAGAKVLGPIRVGDGAIIGANAVVLFDILPNMVVGGIPARVLKENETNGH